MTILSAVLLIVRTVRIHHLAKILMELPWEPGIGGETVRGSPVLVAAIVMEKTTVPIPAVCAPDRLQRLFCEKPPMHFKTLIILLFDIGIYVLLS
jgi:hypothetical protein